MTNSGRLPSEPPDDPSGEQDYVPLPDSADLAQLPGTVLDEALRTVASDTQRDTAEARAAQIENDRKMVACIIEENFDGPATKKLLLATFEYAHPVVSYLVGTGRIFGECNRLNRPVKRQPADVLWTDDDCAFLTERCVEIGIFHVFYEHGLKKGRWDSRRGTALTTYAVNACTLCFPSVYRKWWRGRVLEHSFGDLAVDWPAFAHIDLHQSDPAERVVNRLDAERLLLQMPEPVRTALWLRGMHGATQAEAASFVGLTAKALEGQIGRARKKLGLTRDSPSKADPDHAPSPKPQTEGDAQEGDNDR